MSPLQRSAPAPGLRVGTSPAQAGWEYLSFWVHALAPGESWQGRPRAQEWLLIPLRGAAGAKAGGIQRRLQRAGVFAELPTVLYLPPGEEVERQALEAFEFALGAAPASGSYPLRWIAPGEMRVELRGGANALRQVTHLLAPPLPAERLIAYEVYTPSGNWSGWPPHRHDRKLASPYLEETYYYQIDPPTGAAIHHNYDETASELFLVRSGDLVLVPGGYHPVAAQPGSNVYYLNLLAGELQGEERARAPVDDPHWAWMRGEWGGRPQRLPIGGEGDAPAD